MAITYDAATLFENDQQVWTFRWDEVTRVETYKRDLFAVDMICVDFSVTSRQLKYPTDDEMQGFDSLCKQLRDFFPLIAADWWLQVAFPAFATNHRVLYDVSTTSLAANTLPNPADPV